MTLADELRAMLAKARRYVQSAEALRVHRDYDSAVSRLYYAMFYCAEAMLLARGLSFSSHRAVISAFAQHFVKNGPLPKQLHQWLREAFEQRQITDYEFLTTIGDAEVLELGTRAEQFISMIEERLKQEGCLS